VYFKEKIVQETNCHLSGLNHTILKL